MDLLLISSLWRQRQISIIINLLMFNGAGALRVTSGTKREKLD